MDIFELNGRVVVDLADALKAFDAIQKEGGKTQSKLSKFFSGVGKGFATVGKVAATGIAAGATALGALTGKALSVAGELEQNLGGSEAVFGKYADKMQEKAKSAFKTMGLSTSDYLATANKMGSLFKGVGFDTEEAMDITTKSMQRAADVASIMGIDTSAAMEAIAGAAKGNFTMMDNLGVAINDTTLKTYAQEKGLGELKTTQDKVNAAMQMFMEKTEDYGGNFEKETATLTGSIGMAKAAFSNFLSGSGSIDDVISSIQGAAKSIIGQITKLFPNLVSGIVKMVNELVPMIPSMLKEVLPALITGATDLINGLVASMPAVLSALLDAAPALIDGVMQIMNILIQSLPMFVEMIVEALPTLIPMIVDGLVALIVALCANMPLIIKPIIDNLPLIIKSILSALIDNLPVLLGGLKSVVGGLIDGFQAAVEWGREHEEVVTLIGIAVGTVTAAILAYNSAAIIKKVLDLAETAAIWGLIVAEKAHAVASAIATGATTAFGAAMAFLTSPITLVVLAIGALIAIIYLCVKNWDKIKEAGAKAWEWIKQVWSKAANWFKGVVDGIKNAFGNIAGWFKDKFNAAKQGVQNAWSGVKNFFGNIKNGIVNAFSNIKEKLSAPFQKARDKIKEIANKIKGFFKGNISMPKIKLPHFKLSPAGWKFGDLLKGKIPKLSIDWYKKAMDNGMILNDATIFGMNSAGQLMGGGEAGSETVVGTNSLIGMINGAVQQETSALAARMDRLLSMLATFFPQVLTELGKDLKWDDAVMARKLAPQMNVALNGIAVKNARGG